MQPCQNSDALASMRQIADEFYRAAVRQPCHAFIEFAGLMNEYIKICAENEHFLAANRHTGATMQVPPFRIDYIREKLECIFSPFASVDIAPLLAADQLQPTAIDR